MVPYTGTLGAKVLFFEPGHVRVELRERRRVRNHLRSVHAMALASLGELSSGLAVLGALPPTVRGIVTDFHVTYAKKARGRLVAECRCPIPPDDAEGPVQVTADIVDASGDIVAEATATWLLGPVPERST